jgi:tetratricopeptide (TPR) repeat protein
MDELEELYVNGIASAKAGNYRLAQAFFKKVVRTDPRHEGAWLWLSEVLEDADDIAYCLETVLAINPHNEKARVGLEVVRDHREKAERPPKPKEWSPLAELRDMDLPTILAQTPSPQPPPAPVPLYEPVRDRVEAVRRAALFALAVLAVLALSVWLNLDTTRPEGAAVASTAVPTTVDLASLREQERLAVQAYFWQYDELLGPLRRAHDVFNQQSNVRVSVAEQVDHVGRLKTQIETTRAKLEEMVPPALLAEAHQEYITGMVLEEEALDSLLRYIETSQNGYANRAAVKFQEASAHMDRAKATFAAYREWAGVPEPTRLPTPTPIFTPTYGRPPTVTPTYPPINTPTPTPFPTQPIG